MNVNISGVTTFLGAVRVPSTSNKAIKPGLLAAIIAQSYPQKPERGVWMWKKGTELEADLQRGL